MPSTSRSLLFLSLLLFSSTLSDSFFSDYHTLFSLSHSLTSRVASLRATRGDVEGEARARALAHNLERGLGLGFYKFAWNVGWDYIKNYAWRDTMSFQSFGGVVSDFNELLDALCELNRIRSDGERVAWVGRNYKNALRVSQSLFVRLLKVFRQTGPLQELVLILQREVVEGELLRDCIELGADDLKGLIHVFKDIALQYFSASPDAELILRECQISTESTGKTTPEEKHEDNIYFRSNPKTVHHVAKTWAGGACYGDLASLDIDGLCGGKKSFSYVDPFKHVCVLTALSNCRIKLKQ